jgi:hypothetical protein
VGRGAAAAQKRRKKKKKRRRKRALPGADPLNELRSEFQH